jgi:hypothetical protein
MFTDLDKFELTLFLQTGQFTEQNQYTIEGLLTLDQIGQLVDYGYQVLVEEELSKRARAFKEVIEFPEWLKGMEE